MEASGIYQLRKWSKESKKLRKKSVARPCVWPLVALKIEEMGEEMNEKIKAIKEIHPKDVCVFKIGAFYHTYNRDAYILSYLFNYKIKDLGSNHKECGFPETALARVMARLEQKQINYLVIDRRNDYDVDNQEDYKNLNQYEKYYEKAKKHINLKNRIDHIMQFLNENMEKENFIKILGRMEELMYEGREI